LPLAGRAGPGAIPVDATIPAVLERSSFEYYFGEYVRQFEPVGAIETIVVRDLARQTAAMEMWSEGLGALQRQRALRLPQLAGSLGDEGDKLEDAAVAAAVSTPEVHQCESHAQKRSRGFYRALGVLQNLQAQRKSRAASEEPAAPLDLFPTERACEQYLRARLEQGEHACPRCGCHRGHYLAARRCWECAECKRQTGLRAGTIAADSPLPLLTWFAAIRLLLWQPSMGTTELGIKLGISRSTTVRSIAKRIRSAMSDDRSSELFAGLDRLDAGSSAETPDSGAPVVRQPSHGYSCAPQSVSGGTSSDEVDSYVKSGERGKARRAT
jgi:hypothetical protein